jgi:hypothetical protein
MDPEEASANAIPRRENFCLLSCPDGATLVVVLLWYRTIVDAPNLRFRDRIPNFIISGANKSFLYCLVPDSYMVGQWWRWNNVLCAYCTIVVVWSVELFVCLLASVE